MGQGSRPGRGHRRKSEEAQRERFRKMMAQKKVDAQKRYEHAKEVWKKMSAEAKKYRPELNPENFKP
jgi:hypothetical protein